MRPETLTICGQSFSTDVAESFLDRLLGFHRSANADAVVIRGSSVHGLTISQPMVVVGLDEESEVVGHGVLRPRRALRLSGAVRVVEFPRSTPPDCLGIHRCSVEWTDR